MAENLPDSMNQKDPLYNSEEEALRLLRLDEEEDKLLRIEEKAAELLEEQERRREAQESREERRMELIYDRQKKLDEAAAEKAEFVEERRMERRSRADVYVGRYSVLKDIRPEKVFEKYAGEALFIANDLERCNNSFTYLLKGYRAKPSEARLADLKSRFNYNSHQYGSLFLVIETYLKPLIKHLRNKNKKKPNVELESQFLGNFEIFAQDFEDVLSDYNRLVGRIIRELGVTDWRKKL